MAKRSNTKSPKKKMAPDAEEIAKLDIDPDAWPKFERLVKSAAKLGPQSGKPAGKKPANG